MKRKYISATALLSRLLEEEEEGRNLLNCHFSHLFFCSLLLIPSVSEAGFPLFFRDCAKKQTLLLSRIKMIMERKEGKKKKTEERK